MSFKPKTIAVSVAALMAVAGGLYAFVPDNQETASDNRKIVHSAQAVAKPEMTDAQLTASGQSDAETKVQGSNAPAPLQPLAPGQPASKTPIKLTKQQLTPPPATEDEKLQRAAQQESNF